MLIVSLKFSILIIGNYCCPLMKLICIGTLAVGHKESSLLVLLDVYEQISPRQELQTHIQTNGNDILPHTVQTHNERTSTEFNSVTALSTAHEPPKDGRKYGPKRVGATLLKCF
jgi:hypothetical protein